MAASDEDALPRKKTKLEALEETKDREMAAGSRVALVLCGSFSPITYLHLRLFERARDFLQRNGKHVVKGIISPVHDAYNKKGLVKSTHRIAMCRLATESSEWITVAPWEAQQEDWTVTADVLRHFQESLNSETEGGLHVNLLCGADLLESFATPGLWTSEDIQEIVGRFGLVVISRFGYNPERFIYESDQLTLLKDDINIVTEWIPNDISSTKIRRSLRRRESVRYLLPDTVLDYIKQHNLYQNEDS